MCRGSHLDEIVSENMSRERTDVSICMLQNDCELL